MFEALNPTEQTILDLTKEVALEYIDKLTELANQIPGVKYSQEDLLAEQKGDRQLFNKWAHSLIVFEGEEPVAFIMAYERASEGNEQYPANTIYISELSVSESRQGQGIGKKLLEAFFVKNNGIGLQLLEGELNYSVQTNSADWNQPVVDLYESFGFSKRATKEYANRTDLVMGIEGEVQVSS